MSRMLRSVLTMAATLIAAIGFFAAPAGASPLPATDLGRVDLAGYCRSQGYADAVLTGSTAYDWHCRTTGNHLADIAFDRACLQTVGGHDRIGNFYDPQSVHCWRYSPQPIAPDFTGWCQHRFGYDEAVLLGNTAYDWHCRSTRSGALADIAVGEACGFTLRGAGIDRFRNFYDPNSWECQR